MHAACLAQLLPDFCSAECGTGGVDVGALIVATAAVAAAGGDGTYHSFSVSILMLTL